MDRCVTVGKPGVLSDAAAKGNPQLLEQWDYLHRVFWFYGGGNHRPILSDHSLVYWVREKLGDRGKVDENQPDSENVVRLEIAEVSTFDWQA